jgi:hypothetical protein
MRTLPSAVTLSCLAMLAMRAHAAPPALPLAGWIIEQAPFETVMMWQATNTATGEVIRGYAFRIAQELAYRTGYVMTSEQILAKILPLNPWFASGAVSSGAGAPAGGAAAGGGAFAAALPWILGAVILAEVVVVGAEAVSIYNSYRTCRANGATGMSFVRQVTGNYGYYCNPFNWNWR